MACERGCTGTPICDALDLCCIQFRHDCGKECAGVAEGYSTIQIDVDGNLEVCSNVGGVCDCVDLCQGICSIVSDDTCDDGGIGADYMIREVDLTAGVLTINGAPEHTSIYDSVQLQDTNLGAIPGGTPNLVQLRTGINVVNPSNCRDLNVALHGRMQMSAANIDPGARISAGIRLYVDGAIVVTNRDWIDFDSDVVLASTQRSVIIPTASMDTIPAGGARFYEVSSEVSTQSSPLFGLGDLSSRVNLEIFGVTV